MSDVPVMSDVRSGDVRIGLLGAGRIGRMHAELLQRRVDDATVTAVYDIDRTAADIVGATLGARVASSSSSLIRSDDVDAVAICASTGMHVDLLVAAAEAAKPVFVEKPLSLELGEVDRAVAAVNESGIAVQVGFNRRFDPSHAEVAARVTAGDIGDLHMLRITSRDPAPPPISYVEVSGGIFCDMTIHDFDMARFVTASEVQEVYAVGDAMIDPAIGAAGDLDTAVVVLRHENGVITTIDNSRRAVYGYDQRVEAFGSAGMVTSANHVDHTAVLHTADGSRGATMPWFFLDRYIPSYLAEWSAFVTMVRDGAPSPVTVDDGRAPLLMGLAAQLSVAERRPVSIEEITP